MTTTTTTMTKDELNSLAAVHVMGWEKATDAYGEDGFLTPDTPRDFMYHFTPTTDANDALRVIASMRLNGFEYEGSSEGSKHYFEFYATEDAAVARAGAHRDALMTTAIVMAALKAMGVAIA